MAKSILVTGATGNQGRHVIASLIALTGTRFDIYALTRNASSPSAQRLLAQHLSPNVHLVEGDMDNLPAVFAKTGPIWAVFSVQTHDKNEARQGKAVVDAALEAGVEYFVYSSGDRGGAVRSEETGTDVPHFACKWEVERHLEAQTKMAWCILRPVTYMENLTNDFVGKGFASMWRGVGESKRIQLVAVKDIGYFAALVLRDSEQWKGRAISIAGDELTFAEAKEVFRGVTGSEMPETWEVVGCVLKRVMSDIGKMFAWLQTDGYGADVEDCRKLNLGMADFKTWVVTESQFKRLNSCI